MPIIEIGERIGVRVSVPKSLDDCWVQFEAVKHQSMLVQKCRYFGDREPVFHDIEQQIAAAAHAVEVGDLEQRV